MTVPTTAAYTGPYFPNGVTTEYPFGFKVNSDSEVAVFFIEDDGSETIVPSANYTVALSTNESMPGGTVTTAGALPADGRPLYVALDPEFTQGTKFEDEGAFNQSILNPTFDAGALRSIWLRSRVQRALLVPFGEAGLALPRAAERAGLYPVFDVDGAMILSQGTGSDPALRGDLAQLTGSNLIKTSRGFTLEKELTWARAAGPASINEFYDAANGAAAERMALEAAAATGRAVAWRGTLTMDQSPDLPAHTALIGEGSTSDNGTRGRTCIARAFAGSGPLLLLLSDTALRNIDVDGDGQGTGDNIQIIGERVTLDNVSARKSGGRGVWIGDLDNDTLNANCWSIYALKSIYNAGPGLYIHHTNSDTGVTWPIGAANVNAGSLFGADLRSNGGNGLHIGNAVDNKFYGLVGQNNMGSNIYLDDYARGNCFFSPYSELGGAADTFVALSSGNLILGTSSVVPMPIIDNGVGNVVMRHDPSLKEQVFLDHLSIAPDYASGAGGRLDLFNDNLDPAAQIFGEKTGVGSQGKGVATAKRNGNTPANVFEWVHGTGLNILSGALQVGGTQVVGPRGAAVADATDAASAITQLNALLARMRDHGLI